MSGRTIAPDLRGTKLVPGNRYMINVKTAGKFGAPIFPYNEIMFNANKDLREFFPKFVEKKSETETTETVSGSTDEPITIADITIEVEPKKYKVEEPDLTIPAEDASIEKLTPLEKARRARAQKIAEIKKEKQV